MFEKICDSLRNDDVESVGRQFEKLGNEEKERFVHMCYNLMKSESIKFNGLFYRRLYTFFESIRGTETYHNLVKSYPKFDQYIAQLKHLSEDEGIVIKDYSEKSITVFGNGTKKYKEEFKELGGKYNSNLKDNLENKYKGWIFSKKKEDEVIKLILGIFPKSSTKSSTKADTKADTKETKTVKETETKTKGTKTIKETGTKTVKETETKTEGTKTDSKSVETKTEGDIIIKDYSEKSIVVYGEGTKKYKEEFKELEGKYNSKLKDGLKGWIFSKKKKEKIESLINGTVSEGITEKETKATKETKGTKKETEEKKSVKKKKEEKTKSGRVRKTYSKEFQKAEEPEEVDPLYIYYTTLYDQKPSSELAVTWLVEHGVYDGEFREKLIKKYKKIKGK